MSRNLTIHLLALFLALTGTAPTSAQQPQKPNVVFILADNVGYGDLGYRSSIAIHNLPQENLPAPTKSPVRRSGRWRVQEHAASMTK
jgi:arylsulfatase A-like enzyme